MPIAGTLLLEAAEDVQRAALGQLPCSCLLRFVHEFSMEEPSALIKAS